MLQDTLQCEFEMQEGVMRVWADPGIREQELFAAPGTATEFFSGGCQLLLCNVLVLLFCNILPWACGQLRVDCSGRLWHRERLQSQAQGVSCSSGSLDLP